MIREQRIYKKLEQLGILDVKEHVKVENGSYMPLSIDRLGENRLAIAHNFIQNGDVMADPDMEVMLYPESRMAEALTFQNSALGTYQEVYAFDGQGKKIGVRPRLKKELNAFLEQWLINLVAQGFMVKQEASA